MKITDIASLIDQLRRLVDNQEGGDALVLVQRQLFNRVVGTLVALSAHTAEKGKAEPVAYASQNNLDDLAADPSQMFLYGSKGTFNPDVEVALYSATPAPPSDLVAEVERLKTTIRNTRSIVSEGAMTGFNPLDGDWADRLYSNQGALSAALEGRTDA